MGAASCIVQIEIGSVSTNMPRVKRTPTILQRSYLNDTDNSLGKNSEGEREHIRINFQLTARRETNVQGKRQQPDKVDISLSYNITISLQS